jgi:hypothetical protein
MWLWAFFVISVLVALFIDFVVLKKQGAHSVSVKEALNWSVVLLDREEPRGGQHLCLPDDLHVLRGAAGVPESGC